MRDQLSGRMLTIGEKLQIMRRRAGRTQSREAAHRGISVRIYAEWEAAVKHEQLRPATCYGIPGWARCETPKLGTLRPWERCYIARRRAGKTQSQVARDLGCCRWWVVQMETGAKPCHELTDYWFS